MCKSCVSLRQAVCDPESDSEPKRGRMVCALTQICVCRGCTGWTSDDGGLEEVEWDECWGLMPLHLMYWRN